MFKMYHGGRGLETTYSEMKKGRNKKMEYGPGLYLTNYLQTAKKYAKGGGSIYMITIEDGTDIHDIKISKDNAINFLKYLSPSKSSNTIKFIKNTYGNELPLNNLLNLIISDNILTSANSIKVQKFLVDSGADYSLNSGFGGIGDQYVAVIFNIRKIMKVEKIKSSDIDVNDYILKMP